MSDERAEIRRARRVAQAQRREELELLAALLRAPAGRRWIYNLLASCHVFQTSFDRNALGMAFREGQRDVGLRLTIDVTEASADMYLQMLKEAGNERRTEPDTDTNDSDT